MVYGIRNRILRVNLTTKEISVENPGEEIFKKYIGGKTLGAYYLNKEVDPKCDPLSPENKVFVFLSPLTGAPIPGTSRFSVLSKSPISDAFGDGEAGGFFGPELKFAGFDGIIIEGKCDSPCYLSIIDDDIQIKDAANLWGKDTGVVEKLIREENEQPRMRVLQTGPAGENMVRFAALTNELKHWNGRCGHGAVFGSKNLRAIAVKGSSKIVMKNGAAVKEYIKEFSANARESQALKDFGNCGTSGLVEILSDMGILPTENFAKGSFDHAKDIDGIKMNNELLVKRESCFACPVRCKRVVESKDEKMPIDKDYGGPEYETLGALGSNCGIKDIKTVCKANELCGRYGMDTIGAGMTIGFAIECYQKGFLTKEDTGGLELKFGDGELLLQLLEMIGKREGFGDVLAEGSYRLSEKLGEETKAFCMTSKKMEFAAHEPRGKWNVGLGYALSPNGADHVVVEHDHGFIGEPDITDDKQSGDLIYPLFKFGIRKSIDPLSLDNDKLRLFVVLQKLWCLCDTLDVCIFLAAPSRRFSSIEDLLNALNNITGWDLSLIELMQVGERATVLARHFNARCGITSKDETLPDRSFEPLENGPLKGIAIDREAFEKAKRLYYQMTGMDNEGRPLDGKMVEMQLEELM
ncbi:MAG: aldehyde ferredoxin oxidoreductase family protein [Spirochaetaceae bacterium]